MVSTVLTLPFLKEVGLGDLKHKTRQAGGAQLLSAKICVLFVFGGVVFFEEFYNEIFMLHSIRIVIRSHASGGGGCQALLSCWIFLSVGPFLFYRFN